MDFFWTLVVILLLLFLVVPGFHRPAGDSFFLGRRLAGSWTVAASLAATCIGASATAGIVGLAWKIGWAASWWLVAGGIGLICLGLFWVPSMRSEREVRTLPEWAGSVYGAPARILAALLISLMWTAVVAAQWVAAASVLSNLFPISFSWSLLLSALCVTLYTSWGGQEAVLKTDRRQVVAILLAILVPLCFLFRLEGVAPEAAGHVFAKMTPLNFLAVLVVVGGMYVVGPDLCSRTLVAKDNKTARRGAIVAGLALLPLGLVLAALGIAVRRAGAEIAQPREALPWLLGESGILPIWLGKLVNAGLFAAMLSSADTCLLTAASVIELDLVGNRHSSEKQQRLGRCFVVLIGGLSFLVARFRPQIIGNMLLAYSFYTGGLLAPLLLLRWKKTAQRIPRPVVWGGIVAGGLSPIVLLLGKWVADSSLAGLYGFAVSSGVLCLGFLFSVRKT